VAETHDPTLFNRDLAPIPFENRTWGLYNYASLWVAMSVCIPTYMLASGLIAGGMSWWQAILTILLGNLIVLVPMLLNAHAGTRYGIPFPVFVRASFGVKGANVPAVLRALVACGWFGIQTWIGGQAIYSMLQIAWPAASGTNVAANVVSPSNDFSNLNPRLISFRTGGFITGVIGVLMMPWKLLGDYSAYIFGWLVGYSGLLGPIAGVMIADYFIVRRRELNVDDLYRRNGAYEYDGGVNYRALAALAAGIIIALLGLVLPPLRWLYDYAWFVGFLVAGASYVILMQRVQAHTANLIGEET